MKHAFLTSKENRALKELHDVLLLHFGGRLKLVKLFGSSVVGERHEESDIDVIILVDGLTFGEKRDIIDLATDINLARDTLISPLAMQTSEYKQLLDRERRLALDIEEKGVAV